MMLSTFRCAAGLAAVLAISSDGCREPDRAMHPALLSELRSITPLITANLAGDSVSVTLGLEVHGDVGKIGSYTGRLRYDSLALAYKSEIVIADGTLRAVNPVVGEIRLAGASAAGIDITRLAAFRFTVKDTLALARMKFELEELHELSHTNLQSSLQRSAARKFP